MLYCTTTRVCYGMPWVWYGVVCRGKVVCCGVHGTTGTTMEAKLLEKASMAWHGVVW